MVREADSFDRFYQDTSARILRYGYALTGDLAEAQDVVQEAYTRAWRHWRTVARHPTPEGWVRLTVARLSTGRWRWHSGWRAAVRRAGPPEPVGPPDADAAVLTAALRPLPGPVRQVVALHYLFDMTVDDMAAELGAPVAAITTRLTRGRAALDTTFPPASRTPEVSDVE